MRRWKDAMTEALYAPGTGFYNRPDSSPGDHFRTSTHTGPAFARALLALIRDVDTALDQPKRLDVVDVGAARGELLDALLSAANGDLRDRLNLTAVEWAPRPARLTYTIAWRGTIPEHITGLLLATEWLDNVPLDVATGVDGGWRHLMVDKAGDESLGDPIDDDDATWLRDWWPDGERVEIGRTRDLAWADAVGRVDRGLALAIDYGHTRTTRPPFGTLTGFAGGREALPVPDGRIDLTAHIAADAVAAAGSAVAGQDPLLVRQSAALAALGVTGRRPPIETAHRDPAGYVRALADASTAAELTDPVGLGGHWWVLQPVGIDLPPTMIA
jgi:SAM-dependent MidA family methyltransferase